MVKAMNDIKPIRRCRDGWGDLLSRLPRPMLDEVRDAYCRPTRHYHDAQHIGGIWSTHLALGGNPSDHTILYATAYHDLVYDVPSLYGANEKLSAIDLMKSCGHPHIKRAAASLIISTIDHLSQLNDESSWYFCDLDLAGLASDREGFEENTALIRKEFYMMGTPTFIAGRNTFFKKMLNAPKIFRSGMVPDWWEAKARENIIREINE